MSSDTRFKDRNDVISSSVIASFGLLIVDIGKIYFQCIISLLAINNAI